MFDDFDLDPVRGRRLLQQDIVRKYGLVGIPMVERGEISYRVHPWHWITIESRIESFKRSSFEVTHKVFKGEALAIEVFETRVLVAVTG